MKKILAALIGGFLLMPAVWGSAEASQLWPPVVGQVFPDLALIDQEGNPFPLSALKGKVIVLEPVGMSCPACQAFSGGQEAGPFDGISAQSGISSIHQYFSRYAGIKLPRRDVVLVQLIMYDTQLKQPGAEDAARWAQHFDLRMGHNEIVTVPSQDMRSPVSYGMIPGFYLIDQNFILRADSTGYRPKHNLYTQLLPLVPKLLKQQ